VRFDLNHRNVVYTGADDAIFKGWNIKTGELLFAKKGFGAGVCHIEPNPHIPYLVAVGSYDGTIRIFNTKNLSLGGEIKQISSIKAANSGVWRLRWHPSKKHSNVILAACTEEGFKVFRANFERNSSRMTNSEQDNDDVRLRQIASYKEHKSLAYGCDWVMNSEEDLEEDVSGLDNEFSSYLEVKTSNNASKCITSMHTCSNNESRIERSSSSSLCAASCSFYDAQLHIWSVDVCR